jgi:hypothetical protein
MPLNESIAEDAALRGALPSKLLSKELGPRSAFEKMSTAN